MFSIFTPVSAGDTVAKHLHPFPHTLARIPPSLTLARITGAGVLSLAPLSPAPPLPELLARPRRRHPLPRVRRRRSPTPAPLLKMRFSPLRPSDLQWRSSICCGDYQDGTTELLLPVACPELLLPVACPELLLSVVCLDLLLQAMPTSSSPSRSSSSSSSVTSPPQHHRRGAGRGRGGWALLQGLQPSQSRAGSSSSRRGFTVAASINRYGADVVEYIFWNGHEPAKVQVLRCLLRVE
ncbi:uncharacterized protein LOC119363499 isoform X1 [Triticum dicoccoides]|uniref:uncharacterized protein LOC119363499 isoform X1 n=1 Tax=Triticum dicoccoides TaxID=85692 RepID=UPI00189000F3|nr:uncharacterized protein LOC119363499 isoform X1 [Triticum dicoccoides]